MLRINNIKIRNNLSDKEIFEIAIQKNHIHPNDITKWYISKKSIDARNKNDIHYTYSIDIEVKNEKKYKNLEQIKEFELPKIQIKNLSDKKVVIIGAGPAGLFATLTLINNSPFFSGVLCKKGYKKDTSVNEMPDYPVWYRRAKDAVITA